MTSHCKFAGVAFVPLLICSFIGATEPALRQQEEEPVAAPVVYKDLVVVISTSDGVAAVAFDEEIRDAANKQFGVNYRYRCQPKGDKKEESGTGKVFEQWTRKDGKSVYDPKLSELFFTAGPIRLNWSNGGPGKGWVYYKPEEARVQIAHTRDFGKLDLRRFAK